MSTILDLMQTALRLAGILGTGETASADESADAMAAYNRMLDAWTIDRLFVYKIEVSGPHTFVANQGTYQIGPGGADFPLFARPVKIDKANIIINTLAIPLTLPLAIWDPDQYAAIKLKTLTATFPLGVYNEGGHPYSTLKFWPYPTATYQFELYVWSQLTKAATLGETLTFPPGYEEAILFCLAKRLCVEFGRQIPQDIKDLAREAEGRLKSHNAPAPILILDPLGEGGSGVNIDYLTGEPF